MNKYLFLGVLILMLASCSQQRYGFRKTIPADHSIAKAEKQKEHKKEKITEIAPVEAPAIPADTVAVAQETKKAPVFKKEGKQQLSASVLKQIIPFTIEQLSPEPKHSAPPDPGPSKEEDDLSVVTSIMSVVLGVLALMSILAAAAIASPYVLLLAPVLALGAVISGIVALATNSEGKGMAIAGLIMGGVIVILTLLVIFIFLLVVGSNNN